MIAIGLICCFTLFACLGLFDGCFDCLSLGLCCWFTCVMDLVYTQCLLCCLVMFSLMIDCVCFTLVCLWLSVVDSLDMILDA